MRQLIVLRLTLVLLCVYSFEALAQDFVVNGSASELSGNCYELTPDQGGLAGTMFSEDPIDLNQSFSFSAVLHFGCKDANGADGIVFILATTNTALGGGGGFIGYEGITPSIAVEYDDYQNGWGDPAADHMAVLYNGSVDHNAATNLVGPIVIDEVEDCEDHCFSFDWNPVTQTLTAVLDTDVIMFTGDIINVVFNGDPNVYYGFSAGTGSLSNLHRVCIGPPVLVPMEDVTICEGESAQLEADENGTAWSWESDPTLSDLDIMDPVATPVQTTTYMVDIEYACSGFLSDTVTVFVVPTPDVTASNNGPLCTGESLVLTSSGGVEYAWSGPLGFFSTNQNPMINDVNTDHAGSYTVTITDSFGCTAEATTEVEVYAPEDVEIFPIAEPLCEGAEVIQLEGEPGQGIWTGEVSLTGIFDPVSAGVGFHDVFYTVTDGNGCQNSAQITIEVVPNTPALIIPDGPFCESDPVQFLSATPAGGTWGESADENGRIYPALLGVGIHEITYTYADQNGCFDAILFIEVLAVPDVEIEDPGDLCPDLAVQTLVANPPGGIWGGVADPGGQINPGLLGAGMFEVYYSYEATNGCGDADTLEITILPAAPQVTNLILQCDSLATAYVVSFEILGGDEASYVITGTPDGVLIPGTPYTYFSDFIPSGGSYSYTIDDGNHCNPITLAGSYACNCGTNAGTMDLSIIQACAGDTIVVPPANGIQLDPNDSLLYILHLGNSNFLDSVIMISSDGVFPFNVMIQTGVTYYVSAVAGNASLPAGINLLDPCLSVSIGTPVMWSTVPTGFLVAPTSVCAMDSVQLVFVLSGTSPFNVVYSDGSQLISFDDISDGYSIMVSPEQSTTYTLVVVADQSGSGCLSLPDTTVTIAVIDPIQNPQSRMICEGDSIFAGGGMQGQAGVYFDTLTALSGCDSILVTTLDVYLLSTTYLNLTSCDSSQIGTFVNSLPDQHGCDSTVITTIVFAASDTSYLTASTCDVSMAGSNIYTYTTQEGCDSIVIELIELLPTDTTEIASLSCDSTQVGVFTEIMVNQYGCDSIIIETVDHSPSDKTSLFSTTCDSIQSGVFMEVLQNSFGCDSVVIETIALAPSWLIMETDVTCEPSLAGVFTYTYVTQDGCDSILIETVDLLPGDTVISVTSTCEISDTGTTVFLLQNRFGCDSISIQMAQLAPEDSCAKFELIRDIYVPNVFSPNGDGINDDLYLYANPASVTGIHFFRLYDRWGELVVERTDFPPNNPVYGWDGTFAHKLLQPGVFVWMAEVEYVDGTTELLRGDVTLIR